MVLIVVSLLWLLNLPFDRGSSWIYEVRLWYLYVFLGAELGLSGLVVGSRWIVLELLSEPGPGYTRPLSSLLNLQSSD